MEESKTSTSAPPVAVDPTAGATPEFKVLKAGTGVAARLGQLSANLPIKEVVVYPDRAEVTRILTLDATDTGLHELVVQELPESVNGESLRVKGTGHCTIHEVAYSKESRRSRVRDPDAALVVGSLEELQSRLQVIQDELLGLRQKKETLHQSQNLLDTYASKAVLPAADTSSSPSEPVSLEFVEGLLALQARRTAETFTKINDVATRITALVREQEVIQKTLTARGQTQHVMKETREATVSLQVTRPCRIVLEVTYLTSGCSWKPSYDIRINSEAQNMELSYYGSITQNSGEDWTNTQLVLSTAAPSVGGEAPKLKSKYAAFNLPHHLQQHQTYGGLEDAIAAAFDRNQRLETLADKSMELNMQSTMFNVRRISSRAPSAPTSARATVATSTVRTTGVATSFSIDRIATVESDNKPHRVTIAILHLDSIFRYFAAPVLEAAAYLQAITENTSDFVLLASDKVQVFMDNNFVNTTKLSSVAPGERFRSFLGTDHAVKLTYKNRGKKLGTSGLWSKQTTETHSFVTTVKNTKSRPIEVIIADILPKSGDERVKVNLLSPDPEVVAAGTQAEADRTEDSAGLGVGDDAMAGAGAGGLDASTDSVAQNTTTNNIVWRRVVPPSGSVVLPLEYEIVYPVADVIAVR